MIHRLIYKNIVLFFMFISMTFSLSANIYQALVQNSVLIIRIPA